MMVYGAWRIVVAFVVIIVVVLGSVLLWTVVAQSNTRLMQTTRSVVSFGEREERKGTGGERETEGHMPWYVPDMPLMMENKKYWGDGGGVCVCV